MGKMKEHPRYNILSLRVSDKELARIRAQVGDGTMQGFLICAVLFALHEMDGIDADQA